MPRNWYKKETKCGSCLHFIRHYIKREGEYHPLRLGHCVYPRLKDRSDDERCPHWEQRSEDTL